MKATVFDLNGKKKSELALPVVFESKIREDIAAKYFEADKFAHPYSPSPNAGRQHSASGTISHKRHDWKGHYGRGISRIPRKTMWRRGTQFMWIGAEISSARGGRRAHPPKGIGKEKKIKKKEMAIAINSGIAATAKEDLVTKRYERINKLSFKLPVVIESKIDGIRTKNMLSMLKNIFGDNLNIILRNKKIRAGKGKLRGRKYKSNAGLLLVKSEDEKIKMKGLEIRDVGEISISDLYPLGRLTVYTEKAIEKLSKSGGEK